MALRILLPFIILFAWSCGTRQHIASTQVTYAVLDGSSARADRDIDDMITPYRDQLESAMSEEIGHVARELTKHQPESTLGNWIADAMASYARRNGFDIDFAVHNYGGIRVPYLRPGPLTVGEVYEVSPFDNYMTIVEIPGFLLDSVFQHVAAKGGWPVSAEFRMTMRESRLEEMWVHGKEVDSRGLYRVAMPDYVANGGDGLAMLVSLNRVETGKWVRDVLIDEAKYLASQNQSVNAKIEGRVTIAK